MITKSIQSKVVAAIAEDNMVLKEREDAIRCAWTGRIAQQHFFMLGPAGSGKTMLARQMAKHISDAKYFETTLSEKSEAGHVIGPDNIKALVEEGVARPNIAGMLPEATDAMLDEFFNGNKIVLHTIMPLLNERVIQIQGEAIPIPLRQAIMASNKDTLDPDLAAVWDRIPLRLRIEYVRNRGLKTDLVKEAIARLHESGRGTTTATSLTSTTKVTVAELDQAHKESLGLEVDERVMPLLWDIEDELVSNGIIIGTRREVEGMVAVMANAWIRGHGTVQPIDLDILANIWWITQDQMETAQKIVLSATVPSEKAAIELLEQLEEAQDELAKVVGSEKIDPSRKQQQKITTYSAIETILRDARDNLTKARAANSPTARLNQVIDRADSARSALAIDLFGFDAMRAS